MSLKIIVLAGVTALGSVGVSYSRNARAQDVPAAQSGKSPETGVMVVDWTYDDPDRGFTMQVPSDWKVQKDFAGYNVFLEPAVKKQPTAENPVVADPNITVIVRRDPMPIDAQALEDYSKVIEGSFNATNGEGSELNIFQKNMFDLPDGKKGLLYYLAYKKNGYDVSSAILVMSNEKAMYRVKLTDYKVGFDKNLERYFPVMAAVQVPGQAPVRRAAWEPLVPFAVAAGGIVALLGGAFFVRNRKMKALLASGSRTSDQSHDVEDLEDSLRRGEKGSTGKKKSRSRPPQSEAVSSAAPRSVATSRYGGGSVAPHSAAASNRAQAAPASVASMGEQDPSAAPKSDAFPLSHFDSQAAPHSQPLSVAFGNAAKSGGGFSGGSEIPRSNKPLPGKKQKDEVTAGRVPSGFPPADFDEDDK